MNHIFALVVVVVVDAGVAYQEPTPVFPSLSRDSQHPGRVSGNSVDPVNKHIMSICTYTLLFLKLVEHAIR